MSPLNQLLRLCEADRALLQELRSLYDSLWNGFLTLKFRRIVDEVVTQHLRYLTEVDCDDRQNECVAPAYQFFTDVFRAVEAHYDAELVGRADCPAEGEARLKLEDERLSELTMLQVSFEKAPHELVRLMQACLTGETRLVSRAPHQPQPEQPQPPPRKRPSLEAALETNRKVRRLAVESPPAVDGAATAAAANAEVAGQHASLLERLDAREALINGPTCGSDCDLLSRELSCVLDTLQRLFEAHRSPGLADMARDLLARSLVILSQDDQVIKQRKANYCLTLRYLAAEFLDPDRLYEFRVGVLPEAPGQQSDPPGRATWHSIDLAGLREMKFGFTKLPPARRCRRGDVCGQKQALEVFATLAAPRFGLQELRASARSQPVVFITHDQQKAAAYATVCYDGLFRRGGLAQEADVGTNGGDGECGVAPAVPPERALDMLDSLARRQLMQPLADRQLDYFRRKLGAIVGPGSPTVTFDQLAKLKVPEFGRSLWDFYYNCVRQAKSHCLRMWGDRLVLGFVEKLAAERLVLADGRRGAFLVRFSESTGRLSVTRYRGAGGPAESLDPFTDKELQAASLADRLLADASLAWLIDCQGLAVAKEVAMRGYLASEGAGGAGPATGYVARRAGWVGDVAAEFFDTTALEDTLPDLAADTAALEDTLPDLASGAILATSDILATDCAEAD